MKWIKMHDKAAIRPGYLVLQDGFKPTAVDGEGGLPCCSHMNLFINGIYKAWLIRVPTSRKEILATITRANAYNKRHKREPQEYVKKFTIWRKQLEFKRSLYSKPLPLP